jgi:hypothetical protein
VKARIHPRREWRIPGNATGTVRCTLQLPAIDFDTDRRFNLRSQRSISKVAAFLRRHLPTAESARAGGSFAILAEIRSKGLGVRWKRLALWRADDEVDSALKQAARRWSELPREQFEKSEEELELTDAIARLRVPTRG